MNINVGTKNAYVFISVATGNMADSPWVLGFPLTQIREVIEKLETLENRVSYPEEKTDEG